MLSHYVKARVLEKNSNKYSISNRIWKFECLEKREPCTPLYHYSKAVDPLFIALFEFYAMSEFQ